MIEYITIKKAAEIKCSFRGTTNCLTGECMQWCYKKMDPKLGCCLIRAALKKYIEEIN